MHVVVWREETGQDVGEAEDQMRTGAQLLRTLHVYQITIMTRKETAKYGSISRRMIKIYSKSSEMKIER